MASPQKPPSSPSLTPEARTKRRVRVAVALGAVAAALGLYALRGNRSTEPTLGTVRTGGGHVDGDASRLDGAGLGLRGSRNGSGKTNRDPLDVESGVAVTRPAVLAELESLGLRYQSIVGANAGTGAALSATAKHGAIVDAVERDMREFAGALPATDPRRPFKPTWLRSERSRFELVGVVPRPDRAFAHPGSCGEVRLVYRLALENRSRPVTRLPFTLSALLVARPKANEGCAEVAKKWLGVFGTAAPAARIREVVPPFEALARIEIDFQSIHVPAYTKDMDDHADYVLRAFEATPTAFRETTLFNSPRETLSKGERADLARFVVSQAKLLDEGRLVIPERFLATRAVSHSPRGLARKENRVFSNAIGDQKELAAFPFAKSEVVTSKNELLFRLDEMTCVGCHQTHAVAGFHLLGRDREPKVHIDAIAAPGSPQFHAELPWRKSLLEVIANGGDWLRRPLLTKRSTEPGREGTPCMKAPGWECAPGTTCETLHGGSLGECVSPEPHALGSACETVTSVPSTRPEGELVTSHATACADVVVEQDAGAARRAPAICAPNALGFAGGTCVAACKTAGERMGNSICAPLPAEGYEASCLVDPVPIERCIREHSSLAWVNACSTDRPCRDDYACAAFGEAGLGVCVPPYFLFQARVDGPVLDR